VAMGRAESPGSEPRLSGAETPLAGDASTARPRESGSGRDLAEAERVCGLRLAALRSGRFFWRRHGSIRYL
jgi:hypothetical protein